LIVGIKSIRWIYGWQARILALAAPADAAPAGRVDRVRLEIIMAYSLTGERPQAAAPSVRLFAVVAAGFTRLLAMHKRRQNLVALLDLDDHRLWDLGLSRHDVEQATRSPGYSLTLASARRTADIQLWPPR
jgi:uncharacterized protein YjiS (DUF1127 family)